MVLDFERYRQMLRAQLSAAPPAHTRYAQLDAQDQQTCLDWILSAPTGVLCEHRVHRLVQQLRGGSLDPRYDLGALTFAVLADLYGPPRLLRDLPPAEQALARQERRVLGGSYYRNYDDSEVRFGIVTPDDKLNDELILAYARPCILTKETTRWLNYNGWETLGDFGAWFDSAAADGPAGPAPPTAPMRLVDLRAGPGEEEWALSGEAGPRAGVTEIG